MSQSVAQWQKHCKLSALAWRCPDINFTSKLINQALHKMQAKPLMTTALGGGFGFKQDTKHIRRQAWTVIANFDFDTLAASAIEPL